MNARQRRVFRRSIDRRVSARLAALRAAAAGWVDAARWFRQYMS
jgi:hypothetical protein